MRDAFLTNFAAPGEVGAAVTVVVEGEMVGFSPLSTVQKPQKPSVMGAQGGSTRLAGPVHADGLGLCF